MSLNVFKWVEEIENMYQDLIEKARKENLDELEKIRTEQDNLLEKKIEDYRNAAQSSLKVLTQNLEREDQIILEKMHDLIEKLKNNYVENKENIIKLLIKNFKFDF